MANNTAVLNRSDRPVVKYSIEELKALADAGDAWAISKVDDWELHFADIYSGDMSDTCPDENCEQHGEPVNVCCDQNGNLMEIDHGGWGHRVSSDAPR